MLLAHLTLAGGVEFALTLGVITYLQRANLPILRINHDNVLETDADLVRPPRRLRWWYALLPIALMALATPLGLIDNAGAYGEYDVKANPNGFLQKNHLSSDPDRAQPFRKLLALRLVQRLRLQSRQAPSGRLPHLRLLRGRGHFPGAVGDLWSCAA